MGICGVGVGCGEGTGDGGAVICGVDGDGASDRLIIGARDGDGDGGGRTGGVGCAGVIGGGVREGDVACFAVGEVLEIGARIEGESAVVVIDDGAF